MELLILDGDFNPIGDIDNFSSLLWNRRYTATGGFTLVTDETVYSLLKQGKYVYRKDDEDTGIIEQIYYESNQTGTTVTVTGRFLKAILADRVISSVTNLNGEGETVIRSLVNTYAINPTNADRKIPKLELAPINSPPLGTPIELQTTGDNLLDKIQEIEVEQGISSRIRYDYENDRLYFYCYQGKDRSEDQTTNAPAIFSRDFENVGAVQYDVDTSDYCNFAYVAGAGEGTARAIVTVDNVKTGEDRRELWVDARDLRNDGLNDSQYTAILQQRGREKLAEYPVVEEISAEAKTNENMVYKIDYDLGDICSYTDNNLGITAELRITEINETYERGQNTVNLNFGDQQVGIYRKIIREVR